MYNGCLTGGDCENYYTGLRHSICTVVLLIVSSYTISTFPTNVVIWYPSLAGCTESIQSFMRVSKLDTCVIKSQHIMKENKRYVSNLNH